MKKRRLGIVFGLLFGLLILVGVTGAAEAKSPHVQAASVAVQTTTDLTQAVPPLDGLYKGQVDLEWSLPGTYIVPTPTAQSGGSQGAPLPDLGQIDLALQLSQDGTSLSGYVDTKYTLVYGPNAGRNSGPRVTGELNGDQFVLESRPFRTSIAGRTVRRRFILVGTLTQTDTSSIATGQYQETITGYGRQPFTVIGSFELQHPLETAP